MPAPRGSAPRPADETRPTPGDRATIARRTGFSSGYANAGPLAGVDGDMSMKDNEIGRRKDKFKDVASANYNDIIVVQTDTGYIFVLYFSASIWCSVIL